LFHAPTCWNWVLAPIIILGMEMIYRLGSMFASTRGHSVVTSGILLPSNVTGLVIKRPHYFTFSPGDWVFVRIPEIAMFEWHPFTISSAPEEKVSFEYLICFNAC
jgi:predicted ferric reductase